MASVSVAPSRPSRVAHPSARTAPSLAEIAKLLRATRPQTQAQEDAERARKAIADWANVQAVIAAAQSRVPPGPQTAYVYNPTAKTAALVPIVARAGILFVRRDKPSTYSFTHEPTGLSVSAPRSEVVKTKKRALALLELAARHEVVAALRAALASGGRPAMVDRFNAAWAAEAHRPSFGDLARLLQARQTEAA